jgi:hypothetical protein
MRNASVYTCFPQRVTSTFYVSCMLSESIGLKVLYEWPSLKVEYGIKSRF